jgi:hypothetical protein
LLHILPVAASLTLVVLNLKGYYIGLELSGPKGEDGLKLLGLQFAAKMLELMAMASLTCILFALLRYQLLSDGLPFAAVTAGFEFSKVSLLWSKEFIATCGAKFESSRIKFLLILTILVFTILGSTLGPSAAVAGQPTVRNWPAGGTKFYLNATTEALYPTRLDTLGPSELPCSAFRNGSCFLSNYNLLAEELLSHWPSYFPDDYNFRQLMPENTLLSGRQNLRNLAIRFNGPFEYRPPVSAATVPLAAIADAVSKTMKYWTIANSARCTPKQNSFCYYNDISFAVAALQPTTYVSCSSNRVNDTLRFLKIDQDLPIFPLIAIGNTTFGSAEWFASATSNGPSLSWIELPESTFGQTSIGAIAALPPSNVSDTPGQVLACTIDARWANATATATFLKGPRVVAGLPDDWFTTGRYQLNSKHQLTWPQVKITPDWAQHINPVIEELGMSVFSMLSNSVGRLNDISSAPYSINAVEGILAVMLADGMSRTSNLATIQGSLKGFDSNQWMQEILPGSKVYGDGSSAFNYSYNPGDQFAELKMKVAVNGYGYGYSTATFLSCLVLIIYSFIALVYVAHSTCVSQKTSSAWESITEMLALAKNSAPSSSLYNTGAGISSLSTLKKNVKIRPNDEHLEMVFEDEDTYDRTGEENVEIEGNITYS